MLGVDLPIVGSSDAHFLYDIGRVCTRFFIETPHIEELRMALAGKKGRKVEQLVA
jgi:hypothetical protein